MKAQRDSELRFRAVFEQAAVGVAQVEVGTSRFVTLNKKYCDIVGYSQEEMETLTFSQITHPDDLQTDLANAQLMQGGKIRVYLREKRYIHKNGSIVWVKLTVSPMWAIGEHPDYNIAVVEDITERKLIEEALRTSHEELGKAYNDLKSAQVRVLHQEKMASIGQLAAGVAHEINNPIGFISSNLNSLRRYTDKIAAFSRMQNEAIEKIPTNGDGQIEKILEEIREQKKSIKFDYIVDDLGNIIDESLDGADRVRKIVRDLKSFSRSDDSEFTSADINAGIESTINIVWNELKYKATLEKEFGVIPPTRCNIGQLNQVFMNILVNASHAIPTQGTITVKTRSADGNIYVAIADTGTGIPAETLGKIFDPFFTTKEVGKGTGLGLSIAYDIIKKHKGEIKVDSEVGKGTSFTISIPIVED
jgi:two-component system NtrC family sensor kinase